MVRFLAKGGRFTPLTLEHMLLGLAGVVLIGFAHEYHNFSAVGQVLMLVAYLGSLVGLAPLPMPVLKTHGRQVIFSGILSGVLDSFIILAQLKKLQVEGDEASVEKWKAFNMIAAIVGGLIIWFGEVYAAGTFNNDGRTGVLSAMFIVPPALAFLFILSLQANTLRVTVSNGSEGKKANVRDLAEFVAGILALLSLHNPMACLGGLLIYAVATAQAETLIESFKHETEVSVVLVLVIALFGGPWLVENVVEPLGLATGTAAIIPAGIQAVLWGPLYTDPSVHFWVRIANLSTGALILPVSSLVGVMLFQTKRQWLGYCKVSIPYAILWWCLMHGWIWLALDTPIGHFLEQWAHTGAHH